MKYLCQNLMYIDCIKSINLNCTIIYFLGNYIQSKGIKKLSKKMHYITNLQSLYLCGNELNDNDMYTICKNFKYTSNLREIELDCIINVIFR